MFSREALLNIRTIFFHSGCPDGIIAREIFKQIKGNFDHDLRFVPYYFEQPILGTEREALMENALFVDIHPPKEEWEQLASMYNFLVADHHATSKPLMEKLGESNNLRGENSRGESGAVLAAMMAEVICGGRFKDIWDFAEIIGISDTWQKQDPRFNDARKLAQYILLFGDEWEGLDPRYPDVMKYAKVCEAQNNALADHAIIRESYDFRLAFVNTSNTSDVSEILRPRGVNLVVGFKTLFLKDKGEVINFSLRSDDSINAREIAEMIGGGGHDRAAGCSTKYEGEDPIMVFLSEFETYVVNKSAEELSTREIGWDGIK